MPMNWWGRMTGPQAVQMGMNIFNLAQRQAQMQQEQERQRQQQQAENFFTKMQLNLQTEKLGLEQQRIADEQARREKELEFREKEFTEGLESKKQRAAEEQARWQEELDLAKEKLLVSQIAKDKGISQKDYGNLVFKVWDKLRDYLAKQAKPGFLGIGKVEPALPTMEDAKSLTDAMLQRGEIPETMNIEILAQRLAQERIQLQPIGTIRRLGTQMIPEKEMGIEEKARLTIQPFMEIFNPSQRAYNALPADEKRIVDRYIKDVRLTLPEALKWLNEAKAMKAQ